MRSHVLEGVVRHRRRTPFVYALEHRVAYLALDLDELDLVDRSTRLLRRNRIAPIELRDRDHLDPPAADLREEFFGHLRSHGHDPTDWRVTLVTNPRTLGHVFNPASFYLCRDAADLLRVVVVEVHNTHGERHLYTLEPRADTSTFVAAMTKTFDVSPFLEIRGGYTVQIRDEDSRLRITINHEQADGLVLHASLDLVRLPLRDRSLLRMLLRHPFMTQRTILLIHWHAMRLWLRGAPFHRHRERAQ